LPLGVSEICIMQRERNPRIHRWQPMQCHFCFILTTAPNSKSPILCIFCIVSKFADYHATHRQHISWPHLTYLEQTLKGFGYSLQVTGYLGAVDLVHDRAYLVTT
jgi:hypothetical protein